MEKEDVEFSEDPELEDPESMDDMEEDPDWHCQLEEKGECDRVLMMKRRRILQ